MEGERGGGGERWSCREEKIRGYVKGGKDALIWLQQRLLSKVSLMPSLCSLHHCVHYIIGSLHNCVHCNLTIMPSFWFKTDSLIIRFT